MKVLIACEFSGIVREAFRKRGHDAWSCDLLPTEISGSHIQDDVLKHLNEGWDLMIAHVPCTRLTVSGARWLYEKPLWGQEQIEAINFAEKIWFANVPKIGFENPVGILSTRSRLGKPTQYVQPWMFGHMEQKKTGLWLKGLPKLIETNNVYEAMMKLPEREREREYSERLQEKNDKKTGAEHFAESQPQWQSNGDN